MNNKREFAINPPKLLYHYTNYGAAQGIISSHSLRLTKIRYMNDISELHHAVIILRQRIKRVTNGLTDEKKIDYLTHLGEQMDSFLSTNICIGSFCEDPDILSQWRAYGNDGNGVALGFSTNSLTSLNVSGGIEINLWKCIYLTQKKHKLIDELIYLVLKKYDELSGQFKEKKDFENALKNMKGQFNYTFLKIASIIKDKNFQEEGEWRLVTNSIKYTDTNYHALISNTRITQYYSINFRKNEEGKYDFIDRMKVGPCNNPNLIDRAFSVYFHDSEYEFVNMSHSSIPYRSNLL